MTESEIIEKAIKDYPIGTFINTVVANNDFEITTNNFRKVGHYIKNFGRKDSKTPCIYDFNTGKWSRIVSLPKNLINKIEIW